MPVDRKTLAPPGFVPKAPRRSGSYIDVHPTRYFFRQDVEGLIRRLYEKFGWEKIHVCSYVGHPPLASVSNPIYANRDTTSFDVWGPGGRGYPLDRDLGQRVFDFLYNDPYLPNIDWVIYAGSMWSDDGGWEASPPGPPDSDPRHDKHIHVTYTGPQRPPAPKPTPRPEPRPTPKPPGPGTSELFTVEQLAAISGNTNRGKLGTDRAFLVPEMKRGGITTPRRVAAFLAETSHETDHYRTLEEYGDEAYFRSFLGDEWEYHGRGYIMNTWLAAYRRLSEVLGVDLVKSPDFLTRPDLAAKAAVWFWTENGLNAYADRGDTRAISGIIGAGSPEGVPNGLAERTRLHQKAKEILLSTKPAPKIPLGDRNKDGYARVNIAALGEKDEVAAHALAALLRDADVPVTVTSDTAESIENVAAMILREPLGYRQLWVMGRPALEACGEAKRYARYPISSETDFYDFAGNGFVDTCRRVAGEAEKLVSGAAKTFLEFVDADKPEPAPNPTPKPEPKPGPVVPPPVPSKPSEPPKPPEPEPTPSDPVEKRLGAIEGKLDDLVERVGKLEAPVSVTEKNLWPSSVGEGKLWPPSVTHPKGADPSVTSSKTASPSVSNMRLYDQEAEMEPRRRRKRAKSTEIGDAFDPSKHPHLYAQAAALLLNLLLFYGFINETPTEEEFMPVLLFFHGLAAKIAERWSRSKASLEEE